MKILSVDLGLARTGFAISDEYEYIASPVGTVHIKNIDELIVYTNQLVLDYKAERVVIGLPKNMDGSEGASAKIARDFAKRLIDRYNLDVVMLDERCTTLTANRHLNNVNIRRKKRKKIIDTVSAVIILQDYLDYRRNTEKIY